jgi:hypothetical protein
MAAPGYEGQAPTRLARGRASWLRRSLPLAVGMLGLATALPTLAAGG